jgi:DNA repair exonuclease SbcCD nuclease subunit
MVKNIIHLADVHIKSLKRQDEMREILSNFIDDIKPFLEVHREETRIVVCGDIFDNKLDVTNEAYQMVCWFLSELDNIGTTLVVCGNHELSMNNKTRVDILSTLFEIHPFNNTTFVDKELNYQSGCIEDNGIVWCLYSIFSDYEIPNIEQIRERYPNHQFIGLFHGPIVGSVSDLGFRMDRGINTEIFDGLDFVLMGDIHKRQLIKSKTGVKCYYPGSLSQLNHGECTDKGYSIISIPSYKIEYKPVDNQHKYYTFKIESVEDITNNKEVLINKN